jgi:hypothetical protein
MTVHCTSEVNLICKSLQIWILAAIKMARASKVAKKLSQIPRALSRFQLVPVNLPMDEAHQPHQQARAVAENKKKVT